MSFHTHKISISFNVPFQCSCDYQYNNECKMIFNVMIPPEFRNIHIIIDDFKKPSSNFVFDELAYLLLSCCKNSFINLNNNQSNHNQQQNSNHVYQRVEHIYLNFFVSKMFHEKLASRFSIFCFPIAPDSFVSTFFKPIQKNHKCLKIINHCELTQLASLLSTQKHNNSFLVIHPFVQFINNQKSESTLFKEFEQVVKKMDETFPNIPSLLLIFEVNIQSLIINDELDLNSFFETFITFLLILNENITSYKIVRSQIHDICNFPFL